jgi:hypothetical protein
LPISKNSNANWHNKEKPKKHGKGNSFVYMSYPIPKAQAISKSLQGL